MRRSMVVFAVLGAAAVLAVASCGSGSGTSTTDSAGGPSTSSGEASDSTANSSSDGASTEAGESSGSKTVDLSAASAALRDAGYDQIADSVDKAAPAPATLKDGSTFKLKDSIAKKLASGEKVNYVFSYQSSGIALFSDQYKTGYDATVPIAQTVLPTMNASAIAPSGDIDVQTQISQIEALYNTNQIDCLGLEPPDSDAFTDITNKLMADGIPVFTAGVTSNGNEFSNFTQVPMEEGHQAAQVVLDWMKSTDHDLKVFTTSGGDPGSFWGQGRMKGFEEGIKAAIPDAKFINTADNPLTVNYDPAQAYDTYKALLTGNPDLQFVLNVDITAEQAFKAIQDLGRVGKVFTAGWNVSVGQLDAIDAGVQVVAFDQGWPQQAGFGAVACAVYLATGDVIPNAQHLVPVTSENSAEARKDLAKILGG